MHVSSAFLIVNALAFSVCGAALWKGEIPERWAGGVMFLSMIPISVLNTLGAPDFPMLELVDDGMTAIALLVLLMIYGRLWLGAAILFQAAQFTLHSYYLVTERAHDRFHAIVNNLDFFGILLALAIGTAISLSRRWARRAEGASAA